MESLRISGGSPLSGAVTVSGSQAGALALMNAAVLAEGPVTLEHVPHTTDVTTLSRGLVSLGLDVRWLPESGLKLEPVDGEAATIPDRLVRRLPAAFGLLGPLLARRGRARVRLPTGDLLETAAVDSTLQGLAALGADLQVRCGRLVARARRLRGAEIDLARRTGPALSTTLNVVSAAVRARGTTVLRGVSQASEVFELCSFLNRLGAKIIGAGGPVLEITGVDSLGSGTHRLLPDRTEAAAFMYATALAGGRVTIHNARPHMLTAVMASLESVGANVWPFADKIIVERRGPLWPAEVFVGNYPDIPREVLPLLTAVVARACGRTRFRDASGTIAWHQVAELRRLGASLAVEDSRLIVNGVLRLAGAEVTAAEPLSAAALVIAGLAADGETILNRAQVLDRSFEKFDRKLRQLGAKIERQSTVAPMVPAPHRWNALVR